MEWLSQYWIWIVVAVGVVWLLARMRQDGLMGGCGHGHGMAPEGPQDASKKESAGDAGKPAASSHRHRGGCC